MKRFAGWFVAGALVTFGVLGLASIGLPFLVAGTLLTARLTHASGTDDAYGAAFGAAAVLIVLGITWLLYHPCGPGGTSDPPAPGSPSACGGFNPVVFFLPGAIALATGVLACFRSHNDPG